MNLKRSIIEGVTRAVESRGYDLVPHWRRDAQPLARHLRELFERHRVDCVLDVGGNSGQYHDFLRAEVGFSGPVVSFEPVARFIRILEEKARADEQWFIVGHALGKEKRAAAINVTQSPGLNSFLDPRTDAVTDFWQGEKIESETVQIESLDDIWADLKRKVAFARPYLKLDTQGFDLEVVKGAGRSLTEVVALQAEASVMPIYQSMPTYSETIKTMSDHGFKLSGMFPVTLDADLRLVEFDCVMVR